MPARRFFKMLEVAREIRGMHYAEACRIAWIQRGDQEYAERLIDSYLGVSREAPPEEVLSGQAAHEALKAMFQGRKGAVRGG